MHWLVYMFAINAICGLLMFEWAWMRVKRQRTICEERDSQFPGFRRIDVPKWRKWKFQLGACLWLFPRAIIAVVTLIQCLFF